MQRGNRAAFCAGCEFSGSIPAGESIENVYRSTRGDVQYKILMDSELRASNGIAHSKDVEKSPSVGHIVETICDCTGAECQLKLKGFVALELNDTTRRNVVSYHLNRLAGIKSLGNITFEHAQRE